MCCMTSRGVAHDSAFDELHRTQRRLAGISGVGIQAARTMAEAVRDRLAKLPPGVDLRSVLRQRTREGPARGGFGRGGGS